MADSFECIELDGAPVCGYTGVCEGGSICICDDGWSQDNEMALYLDEKDFNKNNTLNLPCDSNEDILLTLYSIAFILNAFSLIIHIIQIKRWKTFMRLLPLNISTLLICIFCILKLVDSNRKLAQDTLLTSVFSGQHMFGSIAASVFYNKFISYQAKTAALASFGAISRNARFNVKNLKRVQNVIIIMDIVSSSLLFSTGFIDNYKIDSSILKAFLGLCAARMVYSIWADKYYVDLILSDIRLVYNQARSDNGSTAPASMGGESNNTLGQKQLLSTLKRKIIALSIVKNATISYCAFLLTFYITPLLWPLFYSSWKYFLPLGFIMAPLTALVVTIAYSKKQVGGGSSTGKLSSTKGTSRNNGTTKAGAVSSYIVSDAESKLHVNDNVSDIQSKRESKKRRVSVSNTLSRLKKKSHQPQDERVDPSLLGFGI